MAQRISNLYRLVTYPIFYRTLMQILGSDRSLPGYANEVLKAEPGMKVLDVGCGPAAILAYLPQVDYTGIDLNEKHMVIARSQYGDRGRFITGDVGSGLVLKEGAFDLINVSAVLHHLSDEECRSLFGRLEKLLKPNGRIVTFDNVWLPEQRAFVKFLNNMDSGLNIRPPESYVSLLNGRSFEIETRIFHDLLRVPYDHIVMIARHRTAT